MHTCNSRACKATRGQASNLHFAVLKSLELHLKVLILQQLDSAGGLIALLKYFFHSKRPHFNNVHQLRVPFSTHIVVLYIKGEGLPIHNMYYFFQMSSGRCNFGIC